MKRIANGSRESPDPVDGLRAWVHWRRRVILIGLACLALLTVLALLR